METVSPKTLTMTPTRVLPASEIIVWCSECDWWVADAQPGDDCPGEHETRSGIRKLIKRRGYVCHEQPNYEEVFFTPQSFYAHTCGDSY